VGGRFLNQLAYVVAAALFIFGLKLLGSAATARRGNMLSAVGMLIAIVAALLDQGIVDYQWIFGLRRRRRDRRRARRAWCR
jgi:NAD(P) transhydrogenase subunit beta